MRLALGNLRVQSLDLIGLLLDPLRLSLDFVEQHRDQLVIVDADHLTFRVVADIDIDGVPAGQNLAAKFRPTTPGVWELKLSKPLTRLAKGKIEVTVADRQGNTSRIERTFSVAP